MSRNALSFFKYGLAKLFRIFPIVRIFQITRKLMRNELMTYLYTLAADVIEQNSKKLYAMITEEYSLLQKTQ
jgi:hypothetical protein